MSLALFYFDINGAIDGSYLSVEENPFLGANTVSAIPTVTTMEVYPAQENQRTIIHNG